jgi:hypothetical protein
MLQENAYISGNVMLTTTSSLVQQVKIGATTESANTTRGRWWCLRVAGTLSLAETMSITGYGGECFLTRERNQQVEIRAITEATVINTGRWCEWRSECGW